MCVCVCACVCVCVCLQVSVCLCVCVYVCGCVLSLLFNPVVFKAGRLDIETPITQEDSSASKHKHSKQQGTICSLEARVFHSQQKGSGFDPQWL